MEETVASKLSGLRRTASKASRSKAAISIAVTAVMISAAILSITIIAAYVSTNVLELQMQSTEFEQAKLNMQLLNEMIVDVGLKRGSGGSIRFNMRTTGFGVANTAGQLVVNASVVFNKTGQGGPNQPWSTTLIGSDTGALVDSSSWGSLLTVYCRGGRLVGTYNQTLSGPAIDETAQTAALNVTTMAGSLGYLRTTQTQGAWIKLDYDRVRIIPVGTVVIEDKPYYFVEVTFVRLVKGDLTGSGSMNVKVQNVEVLVNSTHTPDYGDYKAQWVDLAVSFAGRNAQYRLTPANNEVGVVLTVTVATVRMSSI